MNAIARLSGQLALSDLFQSRNVDSLLASCMRRADDLARDADRVCAVIGSPVIHDQPAGGAAAILRAWRDGGVETLSRKIGGTYALVVIDAARGCVFLAVDRFAVETLCYRNDGSTLAFSDRADCVQGRGDEFDPQALFDYLHFHMIPAPRTIFRDVHRLPAAHGMLIDRTGARTLRHWPLRFDEQRRQSFAAARASFRQSLRTSVAQQIAGQRRVGAFLSGGTDSSTVAGILGEVSGKAAPCYSIGFDAEGYDEMAYARIAAKHFSCEHHEYYVTPNDLLASIPAVAHHHDQPFGNSSALPAFYCAQLAQADGCDKLLAGDGGDELFGGNSRYALQQFFDVYQSLPGGVRHLVEPFCGDDSLLRRIPGLRQATGYVRYARIPLPDRLQTHNLLTQLDPQKVLTPEFLDRIDTDEPRQHMQATWNECSANSLINRMLAYDWRYTLADSDLPKVRGATQMAGIAVGYPLLCDEITDFSMALPPNWKVRRFKLRWFFKEALRGFLPDEVITKKKKGFGLPFGVWTTRNPALMRLASDSLHSLATRGIVRSDFIDRLLSDHLPEHPGYYGEMVWILTMLEQWFQGQEAGKSEAAGASRASRSGEEQLPPSGETCR